MTDLPTNDRPGTPRRRDIPRSRTWSLRGALAVMVTLALAGCVGIPSSGGVIAGGLITENENFPFAALPSGPQADSTPSEILTDFLQASSSPEDNYEIAKEFLTPAAVGNWRPNTSVLIREGSGMMVQSDEATVEYAVSTQASVNSVGLYREDRAAATQQLTFGFEQVDGQWRISELADGIVISRDNFEAAFAAHALYFFDPSYRYLVPDVRWFPTRSKVPNRIVSALLGGQASWLQQGATLTAFPLGTELSSPVDVTSGRATVDLSDEVTTSSSLDKARMQQQLETSLGTLSVNTVTMTVHGVPLSVPDPSASGATLTPPVDSEALVLQGDQFGFASTDNFSDVPNLSATIVALRPRAVTLARGQSSAAVLGADGAYLATTADSAPLLVDSRANLADPSIDTWKFVWSVPTDSAAALRAVGTDGVVHDITSTLPADSRVISMDVSRDGSRILFYLQTDAGPKLKLAAILRRDGVPTGIGDQIDLPVDSNTPVDATWVDDRSVATISTSDNGEEVTVFQIGGPSSSLGRADGGVRIVGGNGTDQIRVLTADGEVLQRRTSGWQSSGVTATVLATQQ
ncbi:MAG: hypothetical protein JWQ43_1010 [Glaciihabitans sp.]|nr:hypothetical protein [Glaciihabitans sp.]